MMRVLSDQGSWLTIPVNQDYLLSDISQGCLVTRRTGSEAFVVYRDMILCCDVTFLLFEAHEILQHQ